MNAETMKLLELLTEAATTEMKMHAAFTGDDETNRRIGCKIKDLDAALAAVRDAEKPVNKSVKGSVGGSITDHPFTPSLKYPPGKGCAHIVRDYPNSALADPDCCRKPECDHITSLRSGKEKPVERWGCRWGVGCVLDEGVLGDCACAEGNEKKEDCRHWRKIEEKEEPPKGIP